MLKVYFHMYFPREEEKELLPRLGRKEAMALIGPRRAGKTTLAKRLASLWEGKGGKSAYIDLESMGAPATPAELETEIEKTPSGSLVAIDEVQALGGWVKAVRGQIEAGKRHLIISGSSASLLSSEIATSLAGRAIPAQILPLSYHDAKAWGVKGVGQYIHTGGYPECVLRPSDANELHKVYFELAVLRDVAARHGVREQKPLYDLARIMLSEPGKRISAKKTSEALGISQPTFRSYVQWLNDAFLLLSVPPEVRSPREKIVADAKHYAYDTGLAQSVSSSASEEKGRRLENIVAVELVRRGYSLSYFAGNDFECDFIARASGKDALAVQVYSAEGALPERESAGLAAAIRAFKCRGLLVSLHELDAKGFGFEILTAEKWLLGK